MLVWMTGLLLVPIAIILMVFAINNVCFGIANKHNKRTLYLLKSLAYGVLCIGAVFMMWYLLLQILAGSSAVA